MRSRNSPPVDQAAYVAMKDAADRVLASTPDAAAIVVVVLWDVPGNRDAETSGVLMRGRDEGGRVESPAVVARLSIAVAKLQRWLVDMTGEAAAAVAAYAESLARSANVARSQEAGGGEEGGGAEGGETPRLGIPPGVGF